eukprot:TRINITY_DN26861_c0_g1_i1.p1 TRINITY_DN26861_c0_g1~~TRINITY_DN26861_c0_g1_i1.p1  ORF type:complete len:149 (-),score=21.17 TRINITY_DN26861_c0_g1_i1:29-475(-)
MPSLVGSEMCIRDRYQRRVHGVVDVPRQDLVEAVALVTTRLQEKQKGKVTALPAPIPGELQVDRTTLCRLQREDDSLKDWFDKADSSTVVGSGTAEVTFEVKDGILYRLFKGEKGVATQIVVPKSLRSAVLMTAHRLWCLSHCAVLYL